MLAELAALAARCPDCPPVRAARAWVLDDLTAGAASVALPFAVVAAAIAVAGGWLARREARR